CKIPELLPIDLGVKLSVFCVYRCVRSQNCTLIDLVCKIPELLPIDLGVKLSVFCVYRCKEEIPELLPIDLVCKIPELLPIDLGVKLSVCMIHMRQKTIVSPIISQLSLESIDEMGDLYIDIAEALLECQYYKDAKPLLAKLVGSARYSTAAAVWLKMAECLNNLGELEEAVQAYGNVVEMAPQHVGARMALSSLHQQLGKHEEAIKALSHEEVGEALMSKQEQILLLQKCHLLHSQSRHEEFVIASKQLLFHQFKDITKTSFLKVVFTNKTVKHKMEDVVKYLKEGCQLHAERNGIYKTDLPVDDL
ncbi:general transcription factor 3C polypeptide 3-like, partial [Argopecten irradians]|uniref:general transcription factor 3C polypeptide 3-like n=1 Tax=Argopecten irradians TaxID=31199 RepID=UPI003718BAC3